MFKKILIVLVLAAIGFAGYNYKSIQGYIERYTFDHEVEKMVEQGYIGEDEANLLKDIKDEDKDVLIDLIQKNFTKEDFDTMSTYFKNNNVFSLTTFISKHLSIEDYKTFMHIYENNQDTFKNYLNRYLN